MLCIVYGAALGNSGGTGVYTARLLEGFRSIRTESVLVAVPGALLSPGEALAAKLPGGIPKVLAELFGIPAVVRRAHPSLVHLPAFSGTVPAGIRSVVTIHDLAFLANPSWFPALRSLYYRLHFPGTARRASAILVDSDFSAREAVRLLGIDPSRIRRIYLSAPAFEAPAGIFRSTFRVSGSYVLSVGTIEPRKNIGRLLDAWDAVLRERPGLTLVVAGRWGWGDGSIRRRLRTAPGVLWTGPLPPDMLRSAYAGASLLAYPSLYEGFGLPPLEAASAGVPSLIGPAESLGEVYSSIAAAVCGQEADSISAALLDALETRIAPDDLRTFARAFSNERMAGETLAVYHETAE
jgi:glycosyltransferase involved in cell wall biosynthesis